MLKLTYFPEANSVKKEISSGSVRSGKGPLTSASPGLEDNYYDPYYIESPKIPPDTRFTIHRNEVNIAIGSFLDFINCFFCTVGFPFFNRCLSK